MNEPRSVEREVVEESNAVLSKRTAKFHICPEGHEENKISEIQCIFPLRYSMNINRRKPFPVTTRRYTYSGRQKAAQQRERFV